MKTNLLLFFIVELRKDWKRMSFDISNRDVDKRIRHAFKKKNFIFSDIVQKGRRGSGLNHYFRTFRNNDVLVGWEGDEESVSLFLWPL